MFDKYLSERIASLKGLPLPSQLEKALELQLRSLQTGGKILVFGNGGSATQALHYAAELVNKFYRRRRAIAALALVSDIACLTSIANDESYEQVFSRQVEALAKPGDLLLGLTTSGRSPNVLRALEAGRNHHCRTVALCGEDTAELARLGADAIVSFAAADTPLVQELHLMALHYFAREIENKLEEL